MLPLSIIILTYNEESNILACLDSLQGLNAGIFVVDSFSTDQTTAILKKRSIAFVQHPFRNYALQRNWAQENCPFEAEWVLHLDAGERATPELVQWLNTQFDPNGLSDGFMFSRRTVFMNRWIRHGGHYPNYHLRLFRRTKGSCEHKAYDQHFVCAGRVQQAPPKTDIIDHVANNLSGFTASHTRWAILEALERVRAQGQAGEVTPRLGGTPIERQRWLKTRVFDKTPLFLRAFLYFLYRYVLRLGMLDGAPGVVFHFLQGCWFRFLVDAMTLEIRRKQLETGLSLEQAAVLLYGKMDQPDALPSNESA